VLEGAPAYDTNDLTAWEDPTYGRRIDDYYGQHRIWTLPPAAQAAIRPDARPWLCLRSYGRGGG